MRIEIGPVDAEAARSWLAHVGASLPVVRQQRHVLPFRLPDEVADDLEGLIAEWARVAAVEGDGAFHWIGDLAHERVRMLVRYWANLDSLTDDLVRELGVDWSPPAGRPFFVALAGAIAGALAADEPGGDPFAELLVSRGDHPIHSVHAV